MKTYIINLQKDKERKRVVTNIIKTKKYLDFEFVDACDGKTLSKSEIAEQFDVDRFISKYAKKPTLGQIGCALSHRSCYKELVSKNLEYALILEDDIVFKKEDISSVLDKCSIYLRKEEPVVILLSGWFYYSGQKDANIPLFKVYSGYLAHAYLINRSAASIMCKYKPYYVADNWQEFRAKLGIKIYGVVPHLINQNWGEGSVSNTDRKREDFLKGRLIAKLRLYYCEFVLRMYKFIGNFEVAD